MAATYQYKPEKYSRATATEQMLNVLRSKGAIRARSYDVYRGLCGTRRLSDDVKHYQWKVPGKDYWYPQGFTSPILRNAPSEVEWEMLQFGDLDKCVMLDLGCGASPDVLVMRDLGFQAWGLDLFDQTRKFRRAKNTKAICAEMRKYLIRADLTKPFPFPDGSIDVIYCNAMIDCIPIEQRAFFWSECHRILEYSGNMTFSGVSLKHGYGFDRKEEIARAMAAGFFTEDEMTHNGVSVLFTQNW